MLYVLHCNFDYRYLSLIHSLQCFFVVGKMLNTVIVRECEKVSGQGLRIVHATICIACTAV